MKQIAIYPGTFDPITNGHVDIIQRAAQLFDEIIVAVALSARKEPYFSLEDRLAMCRNILSDINNVTVETMDILLVEFAKRHKATVIIKGLRTASDFDYEFQMAAMNHSMAPEIETIFLQARGEHAYISSTMIREIISLGGNVSPFVHSIVLDYFLRK